MADFDLLEPQTQSSPYNDHYDDKAEDDARAPAQRKPPRRKAKYSQPRMDPIGIPPDVKEQARALLEQAAAARADASKCRKCFRGPPDGGRTCALECNCVALCAECDRIVKSDPVLTPHRAMLLFCPGEHSAASS